MADQPISTAPVRQSEEELAKLLFNTMMIYGPTGTRKTSQIGEIAEFIYEKTGKPLALITADGGGYAVVQDYVNAGFIVPWRLITEPNPLPAIVKASKGWWPQKLVNGASPDGKMIVPTKGQPSQFGAYAIESLASISALLMQDTVNKGRKINEDVVSKFEEDGLTFGAASRGHFGFAQKEILGLMRNFSALPVERVIYTSLEGKGEDKLTKKTEYGPLVAGQAITAQIPTNVGDCLHFEDFDEDAGPDPQNPKHKLIRTRTRVWFTKHQDGQVPGMFWPAKSRVPSSQTEQFAKLMGTSGYFNLDNGKKTPPTGLYRYLKTQDELLLAGTNELAELKKRMDEARKK